MGPSICGPWSSIWTLGCSGPQVLLCVCLGLVTLCLVVAATSKVCALEATAVSELSLRFSIWSALVGALI